MVRKRNSPVKILSALLIVSMVLGSSPMMVLGQTVDLSSVSLPMDATVSGKLKAASVRKATDTDIDDEEGDEDEELEYDLASDSDLEYDIEAVEDMELSTPSDLSTDSNAEYVLMNIPYADFYAEEVDNETEVDGVTSATMNKPRTGSLVGGSYHVDSEGTDISGITFPVKVGEGVDLSDYHQVSATDSVDITVTNRGNTTTTTYEGKDALFENEDYAYYILDEEPSFYKELTGSGDGLSFSEVIGAKATPVDASAELSVESRYGDYEIEVSNLDLGSDTVYGVVLGTTEGTSYGLRHLENIWRGTKLAWSVGITNESHGSPLSSGHYLSIVGKTIDTITYYTSSGIYEIEVDLYVPEKTVEYALMNIPYADFYAAEISNDVEVDGVTSATYNKPRTGSLVGGSYHVDSGGTDISGITFPVKVNEGVDLSAYHRVSATDSVDITVINRGQTTTTTYTGKEALFENENYAYYVLTEKPSYYKELTVVEDGRFSFSEVIGAEATPADASAELSAESRYGDYQITLSNLDLGSDTVYGVVLSTKEGSSYGLRHLENIWRGTNLAWSVGITKTSHNSPLSYEHYRSIVGQTIDKITYYTSGGIYEIEVDLYVPVKTSGYVLMNIPYDKFYAAEVNNEIAVDGVTSATYNKPRTASLAGGSYHENSDGSDITGITFPVKVGDADLSKFKKVTDEDSVSITVTNRGQTTTTVYTGKDALFENASYAYYELTEAPAYYKELTVSEDGVISFGSVIGDVEKAENAAAELSTESSYGDYQLTINGFDLDLDKKQVYAVVISTKEGNDYGLRHVQNIWRGTSLAWCTGFTTEVHGCPTSSEHYVAMMGQTINKITYYTSDGIYEIAADIYVPVKFDGNAAVADASVEAGYTSVITNLPEDFAAEYTVEGLECSVENGVLTFENAAKGQYTLVIRDKNGKYADLTVTFILYTEDMPAAYNKNGQNPGLTAAAGYKEADLADYIANITSVSVNGTDYAATGRGAVIIVNEDGSLNLEAEPLKGLTTCKITICSTGYQELTFTYSAEDTPDEPDELPDIAAIDEAIAAANTAKEGISVSDRAASQVSRGTKFVSTAEMQALNDAIAKAEAAKAEAKTNGDVAAAVSELHAALEAFQAAIKTGTRSSSSSSGGGSSSGSTSTGGSSSSYQWTQDRSGDDTSWKLKRTDGSYVSGTYVTGEDGSRQVQVAWAQVGSAWYAFGADGYAASGWVLDAAAGSWYYIDINSGMNTGWHSDQEDGRTYYLDPATGKMCTGWTQIEGKWYFFNPTAVDYTWAFNEETGKWYHIGNEHRPLGSMYQNEATPDGYSVDENGVWTES